MNCCKPILNLFLMITCCVGFIQPLAAQSSLQILSVINPNSNFCSYERLEKLRFTVKNTGTTSSTVFTASYKYGTTTWQSQSFNTPIAPNQSLPFEFSQSILFKLGFDTLVLAISNGQQPVQNTDTVHFYFTPSPPANLPYFESFEHPNRPASACITSRGSAGAIVVGYPINSSNPTRQVLAMTSLSLSPTFNTQVPVNVWDESWNPDYLSVKSIHVNPQGADSLRIRFSLLQAGGTTPEQRLSFFRVLVNGIQIGSTLQATGPGQNFQTYDWAVDSLQLGAGPILIEFQAKNRYPLFGPPQASNGCLIDEMVVYNKRATGLQIRQLGMNVPLPKLGDQLQLSAQIRNHGVDTLRSVWIHHNAQSLSDSQLFIVALPFMRDTSLVFTQPIQAQDQHICVHHGTLNGQVSNQKDTLCERLPALKSVTQLPYCDNFEGPQQFWVPVHSRSLRYGGSWISGLPQKRFVQGSTSGSSTWYIGPDSTYQPFDSSALYAPIFQVMQDSCYRISFHANWLFDFFNNNPNSTPLWGDGFTLEMQNQFGFWQNIGGIDTAQLRWYNGSVNALRDFTQMPIHLGLGWTGSSSGQYHFQEKVFKAPFSGDLKLRFRFASDDVFSGEGVAMDDFCFEMIGCENLPASLLDSQPMGKIRLYPNPSQAYTSLAFDLENSNLVECSIRNLQGQVVFSNKVHLEAGSQMIPLYLPEIQAGVYIVQIQAGQQVQFLRWIKY